MHVWLNLEPSPVCDFSDTMQCIFKSKSPQKWPFKLQAFDSQNKWVPCNDPPKQTLSPRSATSKHWYQVTKASNLSISRFSAKTDSQPPSATGNIFLHMAVSRAFWTSRQTCSCTAGSHSRDCVHLRDYDLVCWSFVPSCWLWNSSGHSTALWCSLF